jgi:hypothetical protein
MKTFKEPLDTAPPFGRNGEQRDSFSPPEPTSLASLTDGRCVGQYQSTYSVGAWIQIIAELGYLLVLLGLSLAILALLAKFAVLKESKGLVSGLIGDAATSAPLVVYAAVAFAGICGGCASSLKWLYHSVAKQRWH